MYNIVYSSSNEYAPYCLTSISSLLKNNQNLVFSDVCFYIFSNGFDEDNRYKLKSICDKYSAKFKIIDSTPFIKKTINQMGGLLHFNPSSMLRVFIPNILSNIDRCLFIDSDTYICSGIKELYEKDLNGKYCAMSYNIPIYPEFLAESKLTINDGYYNAGVILFNLNAWRENKVTQKIVEFFINNGGDFTVDDQSIINAIVARDTLTLEFKYNAMIPVFNCSYHKMTKLTTKMGRRSFNEYREAQKFPCIVHFNGPGIRPWERFCAHPYLKIYREELKNLYPKHNIKMPKRNILYCFGIFIKRGLLNRLELMINKNREE